MKWSQHKITAVIQTYSNLYNKISEYWYRQTSQKTQQSLDHDLTFWTHTINSWACYPQIKTTCMQMPTYVTFFGIGFKFFCTAHRAQQRRFLPPRGAAGVYSRCREQRWASAEGSCTQLVRVGSCTEWAAAHTWSSPGNTGCGIQVVN